MKIPKSVFFTSLSPRANRGTKNNAKNNHGGAAANSFFVPGSTRAPSPSPFTKVSRSLFRPE